MRIYRDNTLIGRLVRDLGVWVSYGFCAIAFTYPLAGRLTTHVPGEAEGDVPYYIWNLWWVKQALFTDASLFFTEHIFTPHGVSLAFHAFVLAKSAASVPLQYFMEPWTAYNMLVLASFTLAAHCAFLLARYLTGAGGAAWVAGLVYGFSPYMLARGTGHLNYLSAEWIPLYILCLLRLFDQRRPRWGVAAAACLLLTAYSEYYYLIYLAMFTGVYIAYRAWPDPRALLERGLLDGVLLLGVLAVAGFAPILWLLATEESGFLYGGLGGSAKLGADLLAFLVPHPDSWLYGDWGRGLYARFSGGNPMEATVFTGYAVLALALWGGWRLRGDGAVKFWLWTTLGFAVLALGPLLHVGGDFVFGAGPIRFAVPLPYLAMHFLPLLKGARVPARFDIMVQLGLALLCAFSLRHLLAMPRFANRARAVTCAIALLVGLEYFRTPYPNFPVAIPQIYREIAKDERDISILEVPVGWRTGWGSTGRNLDRQQIYQVVHGKKVTGGFVSRIPESRLAAMAALPGIEGLIAWQEEIDLAPVPTAVRRGAIRDQLIELFDHLPRFAQTLALRDASVKAFLAGPASAFAPELSVSDPAMAELVAEANLGYVVVHPPYSHHRGLVRYIEQSMPLVQMYSQDGIVAYRVVRDEP